MVSFACGAQTLTDMSRPKLVLIIINIILLQENYWSILFTSNTVLYTATKIKGK